MEKIAEIATNDVTRVKSGLWTLNFAMVCLMNLGLSMVFHSYNTVLPIYIEQFGGAVKIAGLALTSLTLAAIISRPLTGWSLDKYGRKPFLLAGLLLFWLPTIIYIWMIPILALILFRFVQGLGWGAGHTALSTTALDIMPRERMGEGLGYYSLFNSISMSLAPALALWVIHAFSFKELFVACTLLALGILVAGLFVKCPKIEKLQKGSGFKLLEKAALLPATVIFFILFANSSVISFLALYAMDLGLKTAGVFFTAQALTTLITRPLSGLIVDRKGQRGYDLCVMTGSVAVIIAILIMVNISTTLHLVIAGLLYGLCTGFLQSTILIITVRSVPPQKTGTANATYWTALDMGVALGSLFWGFVAAALGYRLMFTLTLIPIVIGLVIYLLNRRGIKQGNLKNLDEIAADVPQ